MTCGPAAGVDAGAGRGVGAAASAMIAAVPGLDLGLGTLVGATSNAVFSPLEQAVARTGRPPAGAVDWPLLDLAAVDG